MEEQDNRRRSWAQGSQGQRPGEIKGPFRSGYELESRDGGTYICL